MSLRLLAEAATNTDDNVVGDDDDNEQQQHFGVHVSYQDLYHAMCFLSLIYTSGMTVSRLLRLPPLVGEIFMGILLGPNVLNFVPNEEAFVMLGEIGLFLLVLEAGIDIDLTTLRLIGGRGLVIAIVGTFLPIIMAFGIAHTLGYTGMVAVAAGCTFAPTSLGIAMNVLRQSKIVNTPVGQLIVAAAIIDDMVALVILSQLRAFANGGAITVLDMILPVLSALGFLLIGGTLAILVLPHVINYCLLDRIPHHDKQQTGGGNHGREWMALAIMFCLLLTLIPATYYAGASPLMGAFLAGLVFCSDARVHHMFVSQFKRVMQWLMRIFFAASIGFQVPAQQFVSGHVLWQGLAFTGALLGKVSVGFLVPNFSFTSTFRSAHLRDCLVVGFSMAAEGEFAFVIAVFAVVHNMIPQDLYASVVLAVLLSTIFAPLGLRYVISYHHRKVESQLYGHDDNDDDVDDPNRQYTKNVVADPNVLLEKSVRERTAVFYCIQTKSAPSWGLQTAIIRTLDELQLDVIDHRSWHPRVAKNLLVNEVYVKDEAMQRAMVGRKVTDWDKNEHVLSRTAEIERTLASVIDQDDAVIRAQQWIPDVLVVGDDSTVGSSSEEDSISEQIVKATTAALERSQRRPSVAPSSPPSPTSMTPVPIVAQDAAYVAMEEELLEKEHAAAAAAAEPSGSPRGLFHREISHLDVASKGRLEGLFRRDQKKRRRRGHHHHHHGGTSVGSYGAQEAVQTVASNEGIELLDTRGVGTGYNEVVEKYDVHGASVV